MNTESDATSRNPNRGSSKAGSLPTKRHALNPERWVDDHGDYLFHFALARLRDPGRAEDLVQETLLAAWKGLAQYQGRSSERVWLAGILKHKLLDHFRQAGRETCFTDLDFAAEEEGRNFDHTAPAGHWPLGGGSDDWEQSWAAVDRQEFWRVFHECCDHLPERMAQVFLLREVDQLSSEEICAALQISPNHLWVMMHRARLALRRCLEVHWFQANDGLRGTP
jgi:RNA polymerase sigma-70 factor (TIGR02943 family)